jgi:hypothetical protein
MITNPHIAGQIAHERQRDMLAAAERQSQIAQAKAAPSTPRQVRPVARRLRQALGAAARLAVPRQA